MGRDPRYIPQNSLQHVVDKTFQSRHLLAPSGEVNDLFLGVLGRAQRRSGMKVCAVVVMATHLHLLLRPRDGEHLASFMCFLKTNLSKEIGALRDWSGAFFGGRYHSITVSDEEAAQVAVLRYVLSHGPKEGLVDTVREWPGVHSAGASIKGRTLVGHWHDRTAGRAQDPGSQDSSSVSEEEVELSPLPCWEHLPEQVRRRAVAEMVEDIDREAALLRAEAGTRSPGPEKVAAGDPKDRPAIVERSPKRRFHAVDAGVLQSLRAAFGEVFRAFYQASADLRAGNRGALFPPGTFPPSLPFVPIGSSRLDGVRGHPA